MNLRESTRISTLNSKNPSLEQDLKNKLSIMSDDEEEEDSSSSFEPSSNESSNEGDEGEESERDLLESLDDNDMEV